MKRHLVRSLLLALVASSVAHAAEPAFRDIYPDTWVATDAIGRVMPDESVVGPVKQDKRRVAGIFYIAWHSDSLAGLKKPYAADVTKIVGLEQIASPFFPTLEYQSILQQQRPH